MWHTLRTELAYSRAWLAGGLGLALGVATIVSVVFYAVGEDGPPSQAAAGIRAMFLVMAPLIVGFVVQAFRGEERRALLFLAGPLTPRQLAGAAVLLPVVLLAIGLLAAALMLGGEALITGELQLEALQIVGYVGGLIFMMQLMGLLAQEAVAAHQQRRRRAAVAGWAAFAAGVLFLAGLTTRAVFLQGPGTWPSLHLGNLIVAAMAMAAAAALYTRRTDFTR